MSGYQAEADAAIAQDGSDRLARTCCIIRAAAMCLAAIVPIALLAGTKYLPADRSEDTTLIRSVLEGKDTRPAVMAWVASRR